MADCDVDFSAVLETVPTEPARRIPFLGLFSWERFAFRFMMAASAMHEAVGLIMSISTLLTVRSSRDSIGVGVLCSWMAHGRTACLL